MAWRCSGDDYGVTFTSTQWRWWGFEPLNLNSQRRKLRHPGAEWEAGGTLSTLPLGVVGFRTTRGRHQPRSSLLDRS